MFYKFKFGKSQDTAESMPEYEMSNVKDENTPEIIETFKRRRKTNLYSDERSSNELDKQSYEENENLDKRKANNRFMPNRLFWRTMSAKKRTSWKRWNAQGIHRKGQGVDPWKSWSDIWKVNYQN
jgi:hypothetical protein